jgi:thiol-disulfide isomerase/thioredoxin
VGLVDPPNVDGKAVTVKRMALGLAAATVLALASCGGDGAELAASQDCGGTGQGGSANRSTAQPLVPLTGGDPLPTVALPELDGSGCLTTDDLLGQPTVINFWATWCAFCVEEMPDLEQVHRDVGDQVRFVGVDREDVADKALELAEATGVSYELVEDRDGSFFRAVQGRGMPTTVFVDAEGTIVYRHAGPVTAEELRALIDEHLDI